MKHATWIPRSATIVFRFDIYFGEVSQEASYAVAYVSGAFRDTQIPPFRPRTTAQPSRRFCPSPSGAAGCRAHGSGRRLTQTCRQPKSKIHSACTKDTHNRHLPFSRHWRNARILPTFSPLVYHFSAACVARSPAISLEPPHRAYAGRAATCCGHHTERLRFFRIVISFEQPRQNAGFRSGGFHAEAAETAEVQPPPHPGALLYKSWVDESPCGYHVMRVGTPAACRASLIWAIV